MLCREDPLRSWGPLDFLTVPDGERIEALPIVSRLTTNYALLTMPCLENL